MIFWNKLYFSLLFCVLTFLSVSAQNVYYYRLTKSKVDGNVSSNVSGGQFICIYDGVCFDSDIRGNGIGNGQLNKKSSGKTVVYFGESYYGKDSYYKFDASFNKLNIITANGNIFAYVKTAPPKGVTTSSLIKNTNIGGGMPYSDNYNLNTTNSQFNNPIINSGSNSDYPGRNNSIDYEQRKKDNLNRIYGVECKACNGTGKCHVCNGTKIAHGLGNSYKCNVCNEKGECSVCHGTGKTSWNR